MDSGIGEDFKKQAAKFCANQKNSLRTITKLKTENKKFSEFLEVTIYEYIYKFTKTFVFYIVNEISVYRKAKDTLMRIYKSSKKKVLSSTK